jgi:hypothetical protein
MCRVDFIDTARIGRVSWGMYVAIVPNRSSAPAILLRELYREDGKTNTRTLANLSDWSSDCLDALQAVLRGDKLLPADQVVQIERTLAHGHVLAALASARMLDQPPPATRWARRWAWAVSAPTKAMPPSTGWVRNRSLSKRRWPGGISGKVRCCSTRSRQPISKGAAANWPSTAIGETTAGIGRKLVSA